MTLYRIATYITVDADNSVQAAQKVFSLYTEMAPGEFEVLRVDGYHEEEDADIDTVVLDEKQKAEARKWQQQTDLFVDMLDRRGAVDKTKE